MSWNYKRNQDLKRVKHSVWVKTKQKFDTRAGKKGPGREGRDRHDRWKEGKQKIRTYPGERTEEKGSGGERERREHERNGVVDVRHHQGGKRGFSRDGEPDGEGAESGVDVEPSPNPGCVDTTTMTGGFGNCGRHRKNRRKEYDGGSSPLFCPNPVDLSDLVD